MEPGNENLMHIYTTRDMSQSNLHFCHFRQPLVFISQQQQQLMEKANRHHLYMYTVITFSFGLYVISARFLYTTCSNHNFCNCMHGHGSHSLPMHV